MAPIYFEIDIKYIINRIWRKQLYLKRIKDKLYYYFAEKNWGVRREYGPYVDQHQEEHAKTPWKHWWLLIRLNWHYRIRRKETFLIYNAANNDTSQRLPYLEGAESELSRRRNAMYFAKDLLQFDVISFDIFDTMVFRPFKKPTDLFMIVGGRLNCLDFHKIRQNAEKAARIEKFNKTGSYEITLEDIYAKVERMTGIPADIGVKTEFQTELDFCFANPYMKRVFKLLKEQRKRIIAVSDMYLSHDRMVKLLEHCGYSGFEKVYVSCDYGTNKRDGGLYDVVKNDFPDNYSFVHIGDNSVSDIKSAEEKEITTEFYRNVHDIGNQYRADGMSELIGSFYAGIVNTHLHNGLYKYSPYYEYGFIYGGLYVLGYVNWIHQRALAEGVEKLLFLSRDGDIYMKVYNNLFNDIPCEYFYWSRIANLKYTIKNSRADFLKRIVTHRAMGTLKLSIGSVLKSISLESLIDQLNQYDLDSDMELNEENKENFENFLIDHIDKIQNIYDEEKMQLIEKINKTIGNAKKIAVIDVGWVGSGPLGLKYLIETEMNMDCIVYCWLAASRSIPGEENIYMLTNNTLETYIFFTQL